MTTRDAGLSGPGLMLFSAMLFGYFGFTLAPICMGINCPAGGHQVPAWVLLVWTLRGSAVAFAVAAGLTFVAPWPANLLYSGVGLLGAVLLVVVLVMGQLDKLHGAGVQPFLLVIFAVWNGYGSWSCLRAMAARRPAADAPWSGADQSGR